MADAATTTTTTVTPPPVPGTPEYDAAMVKTFETKTGIKDTPAPAKTEKPAEVPDKFWNADKGTVDYAAWAKSTKEAEQRLTELSTTQKQAADAAAKVKAEAETKAAADAVAKKTQLEAALATVKAKADAKPEEIQAAQKALDEHNAATTKTPEQKPDSKKLIEDLRAHYAEKGEIGDDFYKKFEDIGISRDMLDSYVEGQKAKAAQRDGDILKHAGLSREQFDAMGTWAAANTPKAELDALNETLRSATPEAAALALASIKSKYEAAVGKDPKLVGGKPPVSGGDGFKSLSEQKAAQKDPRYNNDPAYRAEVERKIAASTGY